ncbi:MAG: alpha amylase N-terminal ig-like domain-containing protein, partial [Candidatus Eisenbacteria bacterium]
MRFGRICTLGLALMLVAVLPHSSAAARKFGVTFRFASPVPAETVTLAGTFNNWSPNAQPTEFDEATGLWTVTLELLEGEYQYKFVVNGSKWYHDPGQELKAPDGFGGHNSILRVGDYDRFRQPAKRGDGKILAEALYHDTGLPYSQWSDEQTASLRLRVKKGDVEYCSVVALGGAPGSSGGTPVEGGAREFPMKWLAQDGVFEYYRVAVPSGSGTLSYVFKLRDASEEVFYHGDESHSSTLNSAAAFNLALNDSLLFETPAWVRDAVFYQIFPERFRNGDTSNDPPGTVKWDAGPANFNFFGGDLQGVIDGLPYLDSLGVSAIYFNPIFEATSNHKYNTQDYMKIDHRFGTLETFETLLREAHGRDIKIVLDGVFNHSGYEFWAFQDIVDNGPASRYVNWYTIHSFPVVKEPKPSYECWWGFGDLPKLNTYNADVRKYVFDVTDFWTDRVGIDGWRLDVPNEVPHEFWKEFRKKVK